MNIQNAEDPVIVAPKLSRTDRTVHPEYISAAAAVLAGFDDSVTVMLDEVRDLLRWHFRNELLSA